MNKIKSLKKINLNLNTEKNLSLIKGFICKSNEFSNELKDNINSWLHESFFQITENGKSAPQIILDLLVNENYEELKNRFFEKIMPGTAGIRGKLGIGSAYINEATVGMFAKAHAEYLSKNVNSERKGIFIAGDSRIGSFDSITQGPGFLQKMVSLIYAGAGIPVYLSDKPLPTPLVSFAISEYIFDGFLPLSGAINTASHNPSTDNGFKIYESGGHQVVTLSFIKQLKIEIGKITDFGMVTKAKIKNSWPKTKKELDSYMSEKGYYIIHTDKAPIKIINSKDIIKSYCSKVSSVRKLTISNITSKKNNNFFTNDILKSIETQKLVITSLCGNGWESIKTLLETHGLKENVHFFGVKKENIPDGTFPCGYKNIQGKPNPEYSENFFNAIKIAKKVNAKYVIASDPDSDRIGIGMIDLSKKTPEDIYNSAIFFNGNEQLSLTAFYIMILTKFNQNNVFIQTRVSSNLYAKIVNAAGAKLLKVLVGFKYFGQISNSYVTKIIEKENNNKNSKYNKPFNRIEYSKLSHKERLDLYNKHKIKYFVHGGEESMGQNMYDFVYDKDTPSSIALFAEIIGFIGLNPKSKRKLFLSLCNSSSKKPNEVFFNAIINVFNLKEMLNVILKKFGYYKENVISLKFEGEKGNLQKQKVMNFFRNTPISLLNNKYGGIADIKISAKADYQIKKDRKGCYLPRYFELDTGEKFEPKPDEIKKLKINSKEKISLYPYSFSWMKNDIFHELDDADYLTFFMENGDEIHIRPSGTEPYVKIYLNFFENINKQTSCELEKIIQKRMKKALTYLNDQINKINT